MGVSMDGRVSVSRDYDLGSATIRTIPEGFQVKRFKNSVLNERLKKCT
jgi:hypothetical protein